MQLHERFADKVTPVSFNLDFNEADGNPNEELRSNVLAKLKELKINTTNFISSDSYDQVVEKLEVFGLPAVLIYDASGELHLKKDGTVNYEKDVFPVVEKLISGLP